MWNGTMAHQAFESAWLCEGRYFQYIGFVLLLGGIWKQLCKISIALKRLLNQAGSSAS